MLFSTIYNLYLSADRNYIKLLKNFLGFTPGNINLYRMAFRHQSAVGASKYNNKLDIKKCNERLEFLGDAVLGCVIAEELYKRYPFKDEGFLTKMRSKIVSRASLNELSRQIGLDQLIQLDNSTLFHESKKNSFLGDAFEALIGAVYIDKGYNFIRRFIIKDIVNAYIDLNRLELVESNFKSKLLEWCQREGKILRFDLLVNKEGENDKIFTIQVFIDNQAYGIGKDFTKKSAEQMASEKTCKLFNI